MGSLDGTDGFEYEEGPRVATPYENGFAAGYDGEEPDDSHGSQWAKGWYDGKDAWEQEADLAKRGMRALEKADEHF